jgi:hypothetical protein
MPEVADDEAKVTAVPNLSFIVHDEPTLRNESNYIARIDLAPFELPDSVEQVWLKKTDGDLAEVCCIPFRAYGVSLHDIVRISPDGSTVVELVKHSGRRVLRVLLAPELSPDHNRLEALEIDRRVSDLGLVSEWSGDRHTAIDVPSATTPTALVEYFEAAQEAGRMYWEWNDSVHFTI